MNMRIGRLVAATLPVVLLFSNNLRADDSDGAPLLVRTDLGRVRGVNVGAVNQFRSIPYGQAPVGPLRFRAPRPAEPWDGVRDGTIFGPQCITNDGGPDSGSEDCLTLTVWASAAATGDKLLPVMVYTGLTWGNHYFADFVPSDFSVYVKKGVIVVEPQYRLNVLGWGMVHPLLAIQGESPNLGLQDQVEALRWIRRNVAAFGGDPNNVSIFASGGTDAAALLASPAAKGLFHKAIVNNYAPGNQRLRDAEYGAASVAQAVGCGPTVADPIACLQAVKFDDLLQTANNIGGGFGVSWGYGITIDGITVVEEPMDYVQEHGSVPLLIGHNRNDSDWNIGNGFTGVTQADLDNALGCNAPWMPLTPEQTTRFAQLYPLTGQTSPMPLETPYPTARQAYLDQQSDCSVGATTRYFANGAAKAGDTKNPVYRYVFAHVLEGTGHPDENGFSPAAQGAGGYLLDMPFTLGVFMPNSFFNIAPPGYLWGAYTPTAGEYALADQMSSYWTNFAKTGDPNRPGLPTWPRYSADTELVQMLDTPITTAARVRAKEDAFQMQFYFELPYYPEFPYPGNGPCTDRYHCAAELQFVIQYASQNGIVLPTSSPYAPDWKILSY